MLLAGFGLFFNQRLDELLTSLGAYTTGVLTILLATSIWVFYALSQKQLLTVWHSQQVMMVIYLSCAALLTPWVHPLQALQLTPVQGWLLLACCLNTLVAYGAFAEALAHWEASRVSATLALTPLVTLLQWRWRRWYGLTMCTLKTSMRWACGGGDGGVRLGPGGVGAIAGGRLATAGRGWPMFLIACTGPIAGKPAPTGIASGLTGVCHRYAAPVRARRPRGIASCAPTFVSGQLFLWDLRANALVHASISRRTNKAAARAPVTGVTGPKQT